MFLSTFPFLFAKIMRGGLCPFKMTLASKVTPIAANTVTPSSEHNADPPISQCYICSEIIGEPGPEGEIETAYILPCSHVFGSSCITRWLNTSPHHNCPTCRRSMIYQGCGHPIKPFEVSKLPHGLKREVVPEKCLLCRQGGVWQKRLAILKEKQCAEERILAGLGSFLPAGFDILSGGMVEGVGERVVESRRRFKADVEFTRTLLEKEIGNAW